MEVYGTKESYLRYAVRFVRPTSWRGLTSHLEAMTTHLTRERERELARGLRRCQKKGHEIAPNDLLSHTFFWCWRRRYFHLTIVLLEEAWHHSADCTTNASATHRFRYIDGLPRQERHRGKENSLTLSGPQSVCQGVFIAKKERDPQLPYHHCCRDGDGEIL